MSVTARQQPQRPSWPSCRQPQASLIRSPGERLQSTGPVGAANNASDASYRPAHHISREPAAEWFCRLAKCPAVANCRF